mgnify:CR=1 FL=1
MRRKEFAARVWAKLAAFEKTHRLFAPGDKVLAAVSGGPDSVVLAHYLSVQARKRGFRLSLVHVHHGLRGRDADRDAVFVKKLAEKLRVPAAVVKAPAARKARERGQGLEDGARKVRYQALAARARRLGCGKVATGHQLDDQAETVLLNLIRGTRLKALGAIPPRRALEAGIELVRPLLPLSRKEIVEYLRQNGLKSRKDGTNDSEKFLRNWIRRRVMPLLESKNPRIREHLAGIAEQVRGYGLSETVTDSM